MSSLLSSRLCRSKLRMAGNISKTIAKLKTTTTAAWNKKWERNRDFSVEAKSFRSWVLHCHPTPQLLSELEKKHTAFRIPGCFSASDWIPETKICTLNQPVIPSPITSQTVNNPRKGDSQGHSESDQKQPPPTLSTSDRHFIPYHYSADHPGLAWGDQRSTVWWLGDILIFSLFSLPLSWYPLTTWNTGSDFRWKKGFDHKIERECEKVKQQRLLLFKSALLWIKFDCSFIRVTFHCHFQTVITPANHSEYTSQCTMVNDMHHKQNTFSYLKWEGPKSRNRH